MWLHKGKAADIQCNYKTRSHIHFALIVGIIICLKTTTMVRGLKSKLEGRGRYAFHTP